MNQFFMDRLLALLALLRMTIAAQQGVPSSISK
jgi:hypothetical protein